MQFAVAAFDLISDQS